MKTRSLLGILVAGIWCLGCAEPADGPADDGLTAARSSPGEVDPLPSWQDTETKRAIVAFVEDVTRSDGPDFVPVPERIAVFDNDGTLWSEQPMYVQFAFALDRVRSLAPEHPEWQEQEPFASLLRGDFEAVLAGGEPALMDIIMASHAGITTAEFERVVRNWIGSARHPQTDRPYTSMVYQPMLELLDYLRENEFETYIVSGGGVEFMRPWADETYGIPPQQVVGSSIAVRYEMREDGPVLVRLPQIDFVDDEAGKPVGIHRHIGRRPIFAFGNSDGDHEMLLWTTAGDGPRFAGIVHHTDGEREAAYDRESPIGGLDEALDDAGPRGWTVVDMANDWEVVFPAE